jgi:hypothetical protein
MADETTVVIKGKDELSPAFKSAADTAKELTKELERASRASESQLNALRRRASDTQRSYDDRLRGLIAFNKKSDDLAAKHKKAAEDAAKGADKHKSALSGITSELTSMAMRYASVGAAIEGARRAFLGFAESEEKMLLLQNATKATNEEIAKSEKAIRGVSAVTQTSFDDTLSATNKLRTGLNMTLDEAAKKMTRLNVVAKGIGVTPMELATSATNFMRNMDIPASQLDQVMEILAASTREANVNIKDLTSNSGELGEAAKQAGYKGQDGISRIAVQLGIATDIMDDTSKGARLLTQTLSALGSEQVGKALGYTADVWMGQIDEVKKKGGDVAAFVVNEFKALRTQRERDAFLRSLDNKQRLLFSKLVEKDNGELGKQIKLYKEIANGQKAVDDGRNVMTGSMGSVNNLTTSVGLLADEFGRLLVTVGVTTAIDTMTEKMRMLGEVVKTVTDGIKYITGQGDEKERERLKKEMFKPEQNEVFGPKGSAPSAFTPFLRGGALLGQWYGFGSPGANSKERLDEALKPPPGTTPPPGTAPGLKQKTSYLSPGGGASGISRQYGSSSDSAYLPADYQTGGLLHNASYTTGGGGGGGGGGDGIAPRAGFQRAGPPGPGRGTGYGGQTDVPTAQTSGEAVANAQGGSDLSRSAYDDMFKGTPLAGKYDKVVESAKANNVPPSLMAAIMAHETGKGTSNMLKTKNNPAGLMKGSTGRTYDTVEEGIEAAGRAIGKNYERGGNTIQGMSTSYAPIGAANDPGGLNKGWVGGVSKYQKQLSQPTETKTANLTPGSGANEGIGSANGGTIPSKFSADVAAMTAAGAKPANIQSYLAAHGVDTSIATCGQFMAQQVKLHGGTPPPNPATASNWNNFGGKEGAGYSSDPNAINVAVKQGTPIGQSGSHVTAAIPIKDAQGNITGYRGVGVNQGKQGIAGRGDYGRDVVTSIPLKIGTGRGQYQIRHQIVKPPQGAPAPAEAPAPAAPQTAQDETPRERNKGRTEADIRRPLRGDRTQEDIDRPLHGYPDEQPPAPRDRNIQANLNLKVNDNDVQFARTSMRRSADREVREARWNSYSDIGAA